MLSSTILRSARITQTPAASRVCSSFNRTNIRAMSQEVEVQDPAIKVGDRLPDGTLFTLDEGEQQPREVKVYDIVGKGKGYVVFFGLPGAFTSVCSSKHVPQFHAKADELKKLGVRDICCLSVNDPYVMRNWAKDLNVSTDKVKMLADPEGEYHGKLGLLQHLPALGWRARRYSMLINEDGIVEILNCEEPGPFSYRISGPDHMIQDIKTLQAKKQAPA